MKNVIRLMDSASALRMLQGGPVIGVCLVTGDLSLRIVVSNVTAV